VAGKCSLRLEVKGCSRISSSGGGAWRPTRSARGGGAPVEFLQLEAVEHVRLGAAVPMDLPACSGDAPIRRVGGRTSGGAWRQGPAAQATAGWAHKAARRRSRRGEGLAARLNRARREVPQARTPR
jgi:hypothetical protein